MQDFTKVSNFKMSGAPIDKYLTEMTRDEYVEFRKKQLTKELGVEPVGNFLTQYEELYYFNVDLLEMGITEEEYFSKIYKEKQERKEKQHVSEQIYRLY